MEIKCYGTQQSMANQEILKSMVKMKIKMP